MKIEGGLFFEEQGRPKSRKEDQFVSKILGFIQDDLYVKFDEEPMGAFRGIVCRNDPLDEMTFTLKFNSDSSNSERAYTGILALSSLLLGFGRDLEDQDDAILFPQPNKRIINFLSEDQIETHLYTLLMADNLLNEIPTTDWDFELTELMTPLWHNTASGKAEALYTHFQDPIFHNSLLPRLELYHEADMNSVYSD